MTAIAAPARTSAARRALWGLQILLGVFFVVASAAPKLLGEPFTVALFTEIGGGDAFRIFVGLVELAGGIGLLVPRLAGPAALGLVGLMIGATYTQVTVFDAPATTVTPIVIGVLVAGIAWVRRSEIAALFRR